MLLYYAFLTSSLNILFYFNISSICCLSR